MDEDSCDEFYLLNSTRQRSDQQSDQRREWSVRSTMPTIVERKIQLHPDAAYYHKIEIIYNICEGTDYSYTTENISVIRLCVKCMEQVYIRLEQLVNWEADAYSKYQNMKNTPLILPPSININQFKKDLDTSASKAKCKYSEYRQRYNQFKRSRLQANSCAVCECVSERMNNCINKMV